MFFDPKVPMLMSQLIQLQIDIGDLQVENAKLKMDVSALHADNSQSEQCLGCGAIKVNKQLPCNFCGNKK